MIGEGITSQVHQVVLMRIVMLESQNIDTPIKNNFREAFF